MVSFHGVAKLLKHNKDALSALQSLTTILALGVGAVWSYLAFIRGRLRYPRVDLSHDISHRFLDDGRILLRVNLSLKNHGAVLVRVCKSFVRVQQVLPLVDIPELAAIRAGAMERDLVRTDATEQPWPLMAQVEKTWAEGCEVEPGESENFGFDFVLRAGAKTVRVYSFVENPKKRKAGLGWKAVTFYDVTGPEALEGDVMKWPKSPAEKQDKPEPPTNWIPRPQPQFPLEPEPPPMPAPPPDRPEK